MSRVQSPSPTPTFRGISYRVLLRLRRTGASSPPTRLLSTSLARLPTGSPAPELLVIPQESALFHLHAVVRCQHEDPESRNDFHEFLSQFYATDIRQREVQDRQVGRQALCFVQSFNSVCSFRKGIESVAVIENFKELFPENDVFFDDEHCRHG